MKAPRGKTPVYDGDRVRRLFRPVLLAPADADRIREAEKHFVADALLGPAEMQSWMRKRAAALLLETAPLDEVPRRVKPRVMRDRWIAMHYALDMLDGGNHSRIVGCIADEWQVSDSVVEAAREKWVHDARVYIETYQAIEPVKGQALDMLRYYVDRSRESLLRLLKPSG